MNIKEVEYLKEQLREVAGLMAVNQAQGKPVARLREKFYRLSVQYKRYWLRENYNKRKKNVEKDGLHTLYRGKVVAK